MKKIILLFCFLGTIYLLAQKTVDAKIITIEYDTILSRIKVTTNLFNPDDIYGSSFNGKVNIIDKDGKKTKMETTKIKELTFKDFNGVNRFFLNNSVDKKTLSERLLNGQVIDWYRMYTATYGGENATDFLFNKVTKKGIGILYFTGVPKNKLKEFFADEPEILPVIEAAKKGITTKDIDSEMSAIIAKYEELKSKK